MSDPRPIAILDSGLGGLTIARELHALLPQEQIIYLADTARQPYGSRGPDAVIRMTRQLVRYLAGHQPKHFVLACNTSTALALPALRAEFAEHSFSGVIEPTVRAAVEAAGNKPQPLFGVLATEATIRSRAYERAIARRRNRAAVVLRPASLLVPIIEEGRTASDPLVRLAVRQYLHPLIARKIDVLILGCTHFPMLKSVMVQVAGPGIEVVDASARCAEDVARRLKSARKLKEGGAGGMRCIVTDDADRFRQLSTKLLGLSIDQPLLVRPDALPADEPAFIRAAG